MCLLLLILWYLECGFRGLGLVRNRERCRCFVSVSSFVAHFASSCFIFKNILRCTIVQKINMQVLKMERVLSIDVDWGISQKSLIV